MAGATGLVGGELLSRLLEDPSFDRVIAVGRRNVEKQHPKLVSAIVDFADEASFAALEAPTIAFCTLGTTIKKAGSQPAFFAIDHDAVLTYARAAKAKGATSFVQVSSVGADAKARTFYLKVKGQTEEDVGKLGFESFVTLRPSFLDGDRGEHRPLERIGLGVARALGGALGKYRVIHASTVAKAMIANAGKAGAHVIEAEGMI